MSNYVYKQTRSEVYTTGFYNPKGEWTPENDYPTKDEAAQRVHYLNGGCNGNCNQDCNCNQKSAIKTAMV